MPCWWRRRSRRDFEVLRLGTAMESSQDRRHTDWAEEPPARQRVHERTSEQVAERRPAVVDGLDDAAAGPVVQIDAAGCAEAGAVLAAEDPQRHREQQRILCPAIEVE